MANQSVENFILTYVQSNSTLSSSAVIAEQMSLLRAVADYYDNFEGEFSS